MKVWHIGTLDNMLKVKRILKVIGKAYEKQRPGAGAARPPGSGERGRGCGRKKTWMMEGKRVMSVFKNMLEINEP